MRPPGRLRALLLAAIALAAAAPLAGCGEEESESEPKREGLAVELGGLEYNVFLTRQLNLSLAEDRAYYRGRAAPAGSAFYGVFIEVCNREEEGEALPSASEFEIVDTQGATFEPVELPEENEFAYHPRRLGPDSCIPTRGSIPQLGPTGGALLLFQLPQTATENRPLELEITGPFDDEEGEHERLAIELDV